MRNAEQVNGAVKTITKFTSDKNINDLASSKVILIKPTNNSISIIKKVCIRQEGWNEDFIYRLMPLRNTESYYTDMFDAKTIEGCIELVLMEYPDATIVAADLLSDCLREWPC